MATKDLKAETSFRVRSSRLEMVINANSKGQYFAILNKWNLSVKANPKERVYCHVCLLEYSQDCKRRSLRVFPKLTWFS